MKQKIAFLSGLQGQDGSTLAEYLLSLGYEVHGILRRNSTSEFQDSRITHLGDKIKTYYGDVTDAGTIEKLLKEIQPDEIYHLSAMSHVKVSWDIPSFTMQTNGQGTLNMLEAYRNNCPKAKFYFAASSECFGLSVDQDGFQRESTIMNPTSIYGCSKVLGYNMTRHYRRAYGLHACNGILFNHTGNRRSSAFVEAKIVKTACMIKLGLVDHIELGNMDSYRDFGASKDYVRAMHAIVNHDKADDFVVSSGDTHSVRGICNYVFNSLGLDYKDHVIVNPKYFRQEELPYLRGDCTKIKETLGWKPEYTFESLFQEMIDHWMNELKK
jgi:GDPmannose 4,6-dehydratase